MPDSLPVHTIGHSTRSLAEFVALLRVGRVDMVVDIRSFPRSRTNPQFDLDVLPEALAMVQIGYMMLAELGGRRPASRTVAPEVNAFWTNQSFHNYADYALSAAFHRGLSQLLQLSGQRRCAIMCSEAVWWRCHRRFVADYLILAGRDVFHLMDPGRAEIAALAPAARVEGQWLVYPAGDDGLKLG